MTDQILFDKYRPHPWHRLLPGRDPPRLLQAYIEITPFDPAKFEIDKTTSYLRVDRPQHSSSLPPALYGFVPRTSLVILGGCGVAHAEQVIRAAPEDHNARYPQRFAP